MFKFIFKTTLIILLFINPSYTEVINNVDVKGNQRLSKESIILFGKISLNEDYTDFDLNNSLKELYKTNFFKKVNFKLDNGVLLIQVIENPIVEDVQIIGVKNKTINEALFEILKLKNRNSYVERLHKNDIDQLKNFIEVNGFYFAKIKTSIINNDIQNSVQLIYDIDLGDKAKISEIVFLGDKKIKDRKLRNVITSEEARFWKFLSGKVYLNKDRLALDKRLLENYYRNNGYYNVKINDSYAEFKDNNEFKLTFNIDSGLRFTINKVDLILPADFDERHFVDLNNYFVKLKNNTYSLEKIDKIIKKVDQIALSKKYEFLNANIEEKIVNINRLNLKIVINETEKFYVEKINISGNSYTIEEVIRNSLIVDEGDPYNELLFGKSINRIKSKGIFKSVKSNIQEGSNKNLKIVDIIVEEQPTGEISLGAGVGTSGGTVGFGIKENNFLGQGISLNSSLSISASTVKGEVTYSKPNFNYSDNTLSTSIRSTSTDNLVDFGYKTSNLGFSFATQFEQYENLFFRPEFAANYEKLQTTSNASANLKKQKGNYSDIFFNYSLDYDLRNKKYQTSDGFRNIFYQELPIVSNNYELINSFQSTAYQELPSDMIGKISFYAKSVNTLKDEDVRISKRLYIPSSKLRGFESGKIGPIDNSDFVGGNYVSALNVSTTLPKLMPSLQNLDFSIFLDAANVWGVDYDSALDKSSKIRSSTGIAMDVFTPIGPLNFSFSQPITKASSDKTEAFRFNLGTTF